MGWAFKWQKNVDLPAIILRLKKKLVMLRSRCADIQFLWLVRWMWLFVKIILLLRSTTIDVKSPYVLHTAVNEWTGMRNWRLLGPWPYDVFFLSKFNLLVVFMFNLHFSDSKLLLFNHDIRFSTSTFILFNLDSRFLSSAFILFKHVCYSSLTFVLVKRDDFVICF